MPLDLSAGHAQNAASAVADPAMPRWLLQLIQAERIAPDVAETAMTKAAGDARQAGMWLTDHGVLDQHTLALAQAEDFGLPFLDPREYRVHADNRGVLAEDLARTHQVFPLFVLDRVITLAVVWPLEMPVLDQIRLRTACEVDQCLVTPRDWRQLVEWAYSGQHKQTATKSAAELAWEEILRDVADAPAVKLVNVLLEQAAACQASDVHIDAEEQALRVRFRIDGMLREVPAPPRELLSAIVSRIKVLSHLDIAETRRPQDGHFKLAVDRVELDVRVSTLPSASGEAVVLRLLRGAGRLLSLEDLGMDDNTRATFDRVIRVPYGMVLVTGPTGSGKTTTLYSALSRLDRVRHSVITLEDPVEIRLPQMRQVAINPKAGLTFLTGLRAILRQDPDIIMIGEIRDGETAETALQAALTGHLVLSTLHTNSAAGAPARLLDMGVPDFLVTSALVSVLAQRLCRRLCRECARPEDGFDHVRDWLADSVIERLRTGRVLRAMGCKRCGNTGYDGRVGLFELLTMTDDIRRAVIDRADERRLQELARQSGMRLLGEDGLHKVHASLTSLSEVLRVAGRVENFDHAPPAPSAGPAGAGTADEDAFDIDAYESLLSRWLRASRSPPARGRAGAAAARVDSPGREVV